MADRISMQPISRQRLYPCWLAAARQPRNQADCLPSCESSRKDSTAVARKSAFLSFRYAHPASVAPIDDAGCICAQSIGSTETDPDRHTGMDTAMRARPSPWLGLDTVRITPECGSWYSPISHLSTMKILSSKALRTTGSFGSTQTAVTALSRISSMRIVDSDNTSGSSSNTHSCQDDNGLVQRI